MRLIALTGPPATGKTTILNHLKKQDYPTFNLDQRLYDLIEKDDQLWASIAHLYPKNIIDNQGRIDAQKFRHQIWQNLEQRDFFEKVLTPLLIKDITIYLKSINTPLHQKDYVFCESALIFQSGLEEFLFDIWYIHVDPPEQDRRLQELYLLSPEEAATQIINTPRLPASKKNSCQIIDNSDTIEYTFSQVSAILQKHDTTS